MKKDSKNDRVAYFESLSFQLMLRWKVKTKRWKKNADCSSKMNEDPNPTGLTIKLVTDLQFGMAQSSYFKICIVSSNWEVY